MKLLVRNKVEDVGHWKRVFDAQAAASNDSGLQLVDLWRSADEPDQVFFVFDGEYHFLEELSD